MKGKGKTPQQDSKDCPLQFPDLTPIDHTKECHKFTQVLGRTQDDNLGMEELDTLQGDLERLLASVGRRLKLLESEIQVLVNWQDKKDKKPVTVGKVQPEPAAGKRGKGALPEERPSKKFKDISGTSKATQPSSSVASPASRSKSKLPQTKGVEGEAGSSSTELPRVVKNECVDRFWQAMEAYCRPITDDDIRFLEEQLRKHEDEDAAFFKIPPLGRHYRDVWAEEDLLEEMAEGAKVNEKKRISNHSNQSSNGPSEASALLKKAESSMEESPFGPLTQRLVSALLEENLMTPMDDVMTDMAENADEAPAISPRMLAKQLNIGNPATLERRIQQELEEQGILETEEEAEDDPSNEILQELKHAQAELRPLLQWKVKHLKDLLRKAREQQARQQLWKKFDECDAKLHEEYRKLTLARQKKKPNLKRERESVKKILKEWWTIYQTLDESYNE